MKRLLIFFFALVCLFYTSTTVAQISEFEGYVLDRKTLLPIPFATIQIQGQLQNGIVTDLRGWFRLQNVTEAAILIVSHVGYEKNEFAITSISYTKELFLTPLTYQLSEVQVLAGENPALPIIRQAIKNRPIHDPESLDSYSFESYTKTIMTLDGLKEEPEVDDTTANFLQGGHIFMAESLSEVIYRKPGKRNETVKASKMSGIENPLVAMASTSFQPFSFYEDHIKILEVPYVNPLSNDGLRKYDYFLEDSISYESGKSYIITYQPKEGKTYQLGKGLMHISSNQFALENFLIKPADPGTGLLFELQQKNKWNGEYWFPEQLNSIYLTSEFDLNGKDFKIVSQTFLSQVKLNTLDKSVKFGPIGLNYEIENDKYDWAEIRLDSLSSREYLTYVRFDQMDERDKKRLNFASQMVTNLSSGRIPLGIVDLLPNRLLRINRFERVGLGLGLSSNDRLSDFLRVEGYFRYGFGDKRWKYGGGLDWRLEKKYDSKLKFYYSQDLIEPGVPTFLKSKSFSSGGAAIRSFEASRMDQVERFSVEFSQMPMKGVRFGVFGSVENRLNLLDYSIRRPTDSYSTEFVATEAGIDLRILGDENVSRIGNNLISWTSSYPILNARVSRAIPDLIGGTVDFWNTELKFQHQWSSGNSLNQFHLSAQGVWGNNLPISYLNTGYGINLRRQGDFDFSFSFPGFLQTMFVYEFLSDRSMHVSYSHQTGPLFQKKLGRSSIAPQLKFHQSFAIGTLSNPEFYDFVEFKTMEKGYWESGIELTNILKQKSGLQYQGWGFGVFYRYGPYANPRANENLTFTLSLTASF